jgi:ketosteroid isomerase-like protein
MKTTRFFLFIFGASLALAGCEAPPAANTNTNINTNANAAKPMAAAPTIDTLFAMDKQANEAWIKGDAKFFEGFLNEKFVMHEMGQQMGKAEILKMVASNKCDVKTWNLEDPQMVKIDNDTYVVSYKGNFDGSCTGPDGKSMKLPSPTRAASVYVRGGDKWMGAYHGETMIVDPKVPPPPPVLERAEPKKESSNSAANSSSMANSNAASNSNMMASSKPTASANTDALVKLHTAGWEAFKAKDAKKFMDMTAANLSIVDPRGMWITGRDAVIKHWTEEMKCEGVNNVSVSDGMSTALSPTVEILTLKGKADGTCDGHKNGSLNQTAVYVKEGDVWKLAFMLESPAV